MFDFQIMTKSVNLFNLVSGINNTVAVVDDCSKCACPYSISQWLFYPIYAKIRHSSSHTNERCPQHSTR